MINIGYFHEHTFVCTAIKKLLSDEPDFKIIFETDHFGDLEYKLTKYPVHILVITRNDQLAQLIDITHSIKSKHDELP